MKAARLHEYHQALKVEQIDEPKILGPWDVIVKIGAAGLCRTDLHIQEGQWAEKSGVTLPYVPGHENAGWIHEVGSGVTNVEVGDTVIVHPFISCGLCRPCRRGDDMHCLNGEFPGIGRDGGFAEFLHTSARSVIKLDPSLHPTDIAALADAGLTAIHAVKKAIPVLGAGTKAVVIGAGGLGHMAIQILDAICPARIVAVDLADDKLALAREVGAAETVRADAEDAAAQVREATRGRGAELVLDLVGSDATLALAGQAGRSEGDLALVGLAGGTYPLSFFSQAYELAVATTYWGSAIELIEVIELARAGKIRAHVERFGLDRVGEAYARLRAGEIDGRAVVCPHG